MKKCFRFTFWVVFFCDTFWSIFWVVTFVTFPLVTHLGFDISLKKFSENLTNNSWINLQLILSLIFKFGLIFINNYSAKNFIWLAIAASLASFASWRAALGAIFVMVADVGGRSLYQPITMLDKSKSSRHMSAIPMNVFLSNLP